MYAHVSFSQNFHSMSKELGLEWKTALSPQKETLTSAMGWISPICEAIGTLTCWETGQRNPSQLSSHNYKWSSLYWEVQAILDLLPPSRCDFQGKRKVHVCFTIVWCETPGREHFLSVLLFSRKWQDILANGASWEYPGSFLTWKFLSSYRGHGSCRLPFINRNWLFILWYADNCMKFSIVPPFSQDVKNG